MTKRNKFITDLDIKLEGDEFGNLTFYQKRNIQAKNRLIMTKNLLNFALSMSEISFKQIRIFSKSKEISQIARNEISRIKRTYKKIESLEKEYRKL